MLIKGLTSCIFQDFYAAVCLCFKTSHPGMLTQCFSVKYFMQTDLICDGVNLCCLEFTGGTKTESKLLPAAVASRAHQPLTVLLFLLSPLYFPFQTDSTSCFRCEWMSGRPNSHPMGTFSLVDKHLISSVTRRRGHNREPTDGSGLQTPV